MLRLGFQKKIYIGLIFFVFLLTFVAAEEVKLFKLLDFSGAFNFQYQITSEKEGTFDQISLDYFRNYFGGGIQLFAKGSIYHPNFLNFRIDLNIVGHSAKDRLFSDASVNNAINNVYNIYLYFLEKKKINFEFYTFRNFSPADRAFLGRYYTTFQSTGFKIISKLMFLPFDLNIYNSRMKSESLTYFERDEETDNIDLRVKILEKPKTKSQLTLKAKDYSEAVYDVNYRSLDILASFNHHYGVKDMNFFSSLLTYNNMRGDYDFEVLYFRSDNRYYLNSNLYLNGTYNLNWDNSFDRASKKHKFTGKVNHQLFESLISSLLIGSRIEDSNFQGLNAFFYQLSFNYKKKIPSGGIRFQFDFRNESANYSSYEDVVNKSEIFDFSLYDTIILVQPGINIDSILVTDINSTHVYFLDVDYQVNILNNVITITRLPGGGIPFGKKVLVHYEYLSYPDFSLDTLFYQFTFQLNFLKYFFLFYIKSSNNQEIKSDYIIPPYESYNREVMGVQFVSRFLNVNYTHEQYNSNLANYISRNFRLSGHLDLFKWMKLSANLNINRLNYDPESFFSRFNAYSLECSITPLNRMRINALYRKINYTSLGYSRDRESILLKFQWDFRKIILNIFYEHILTTSDLNEKSHDFFSLMIRRVF